jgi:hypothetical protein
MEIAFCSYGRRYIGLSADLLRHFWPGTMDEKNGYPARRCAMADDLKNRGPQDRSRVNLNEDWEVVYWSKQFGVSTAQLKAAVDKVGPSSQKLAEHFGKTRAPQKH